MNLTKKKQAAKLKITFKWKALFVAFIWTGFYWMVPDFWASVTFGWKLERGLASIYPIRLYSSCYCILPVVSLLVHIQVAKSPECLAQYMLADTLSQTLHVVIAGFAVSGKMNTLGEWRKTALTNHVLPGFPVMDTVDMLEFICLFLAFHHLSGNTMKHFKYIYFVIFVLVLYGVVVAQWSKSLG